MITWDKAQQLVRIGLQLAAGALVQQGVITADMATTGVGAALSLAGIVWWVIWDRKRAA